VVDWQYEIWSNSHNQRLDNAGRFISAQYLSKPFTPAPPKPIPMPEGGGARSSLPLYNFANYNVEHHFLPDMPVRVSAMRGLGAYMNVFTIESFMDELAAAAGADPVEFRLRISTTRAGATWCSSRRRSSAGTPGASACRTAAWAFSFAQYKNLMSYLALAVEVSIVPETGEIRIERAIAAIDCGQVVNPDGVRNQVEGGILQSASLDPVRARCSTTPSASAATTGAAIRSCGSRTCRGRWRCTSSIGPGRRFWGRAKLRRGRRPRRWGMRWRMLRGGGCGGCRWRRGGG
jgi:nicotinate dehydrogenase subunit B